MIKLNKLFSREHSLFYTWMWNKSDRLGFKYWLNHNLRNSLFLKPDKSNKVSVWYEKKEFNQIREKIAERLIKNSLFLNKLAKTLRNEEKIIAPVLKGKIKVKDIKYLKKYYKSITKWWSAMVILFEIPDLEIVPEEICQRAFLLRRSSEKYSDQQDSVFIKFYKKTYPEYKNLTFLVAPSEVFKNLNKKFTKTEIKEIKKRKNGYGLFNSKLYLLVELQKKFKKLSIELESEEITIGIKEIKGFPAMRGITVGKIRIVKYKSQIRSIKKGEILVTEMTSSDYAPIFPKVKAIITDEGGITCHAAIISRELNIPCIIGTKIATRVLRDGDLVEVDANKGIVKIIKKEK